MEQIMLLKLFNLVLFGIMIIFFSEDFIKPDLYE